MPTVTHRLEHVKSGIAEHVRWLTASLDDAAHRKGKEALLKLLEADEKDFGHRRDEWPTRDSLCRYLKPLDDLFFNGEVCQHVAEFSVSHFLGKPENLGLAGWMTLSPRDYKCWIWVSTRMRASWNYLEPGQRPKEVFSTLLHEMLHVLVRTLMCRCHDCQHTDNARRTTRQLEAGKTGHGESWAKAANTIQDVARSSRIFQHDLFGCDLSEVDLNIKSSVEREKRGR
jgi:hypothetical protein